MQLVSFGAQDVYLTAKPQITFFKTVYRRHTNFAIEAIEQTFNGTVDFGRKVTCTISRNADLINRMYLQLSIPAVTSGASDDFAWVRYFGHALVKSVEVEIGGQRIDKHYSEWLQIWMELTLPEEKRAGYLDMIGDIADQYTNGSPADKSAFVCYVPLQFWFNRNVGLSLPLIALQYHEVKINVEFRAFGELYTATQAPTTPTITSGSLYVDYVYLDTDERRRFAQTSHEYLIEQVQHTGAEVVATTTPSIRLNFNHPVKELIWATRLATREDTTAPAGISAGFNQWFNFSTTADYGYEWDEHHLVDAKLQLNGHDRMSTRDARYYGEVQPYQHHTRIPRVSPGIYVYSFANQPEEHQPSGTVNMSRIDNATLKMTLSSSSSTSLLIFAHGYNVLRVMSGMGGMAYSS